MTYNKKKILTKNTVNKILVPTHGFRIKQTDILETKN